MQICLILVNLLGNQITDIAVVSIKRTGIRIMSRESGAGSGVYRQLSLVYADNKTLL